MAGSPSCKLPRVAAPLSIQRSRVRHGIAPCLVSALSTRHISDLPEWEVIVFVCGWSCSCSVRELNRSTTLDLLYTSHTGCIGIGTNVRAMHTPFLKGWSWALRFCAGPPGFRCSPGDRHTPCLWGSGAGLPGRRPLACFCGVRFPYRDPAGREARIQTWYFVLVCDSSGPQAFPGRPPTLHYRWRCRDSRYRILEVEPP